MVAVEPLATVGGIVVLGLLEGLGWLIRVLLRVDAVYHVLLVVRGRVGGWGEGLGHREEFEVVMRVEAAGESVLECLEGDERPRVGKTRAEHRRPLYKLESATDNAKPTPRPLASGARYTGLHVTGVTVTAARR